MEMSPEQMTLAALILAPMTVLGLAGIVRGYHLHIRVWRGNRKDDNGNN